ncbi:MAG: hypothetical protein WC465_04190 [Patescibacteria group bacterium]
MSKKVYLGLIIALAFLLMAQSGSASIYVGRYSNIFDLNKDQAINLSDTSLVSGWLTSNNHAKCYQFYQSKLSAPQNTTGSSPNYSVSDSWCSSLFGLVSDAVRTQTYNEIVDINNDGKVNLSDISLIANWYNNDYSQACYYQFTKKYEVNDIHWCAGTFQGIVDTIGEAVGGPDIGVDYIQIIPDMPIVNEPVEIKIQARNTGTTNITSQAILDNIYKVLGNLVVTETTMPKVSSANPIKPGDTFYYSFKGTYPKKRNEFISFVYNPHDTDAELSFWNNSASKWITVYDTNLLNVIEYRAINVTKNSVRIWWRANIGSTGEYRYSKDKNALSNLSWLTEGVSNNPDVTGNMFASQVDLSGLDAGATYYIQVRKNLGSQYGQLTEFSFVTGTVGSYSPSLDIAETRVDQLTTNSARIYWQAVNMGSNGWYRHATNTNALSNISWLNSGVSDDATVTGNINASIVTLNNLLADTKYYVELKKTAGIPGELSYKYGAPKIIDFTTYGSPGYIPEEKVFVCHVMGNNKTNTLEIAKSALAAHLAHGDKEGPCTVAAKPIKVETGLINRVKGRILLQVESRGEAYYVKPTDGKKIYIKDGETAYGVMRDTGLGIKNVDLQKIPIGNDSRLNITLPPTANAGSTTNQALVNRVKGRILLQVENNGEAWYVNPADGKRYYMKDGTAAYQIMRYLSLGISNDDLNKISE